MKRKIDNMGRVCLPLDIRKDLDMYVGDKVNIYRLKNSIIISKNDIDTVAEEITRGVFYG